MRIYLFCNETFGAAFARVAERFALEHRVPVTVVYSDRRKVAPHIRAARAIREFVRRLRNPYVRRRYVSDVNATRFYRSIRPEDAGVITGFNQIFGPALIAAFGSLVNVHPSLLPFYRGPAPTAWCLLQGETHTGFTFHEVTERIDDGPIVYQDVVPVGDLRDARALAEALAAHAAPVFAKYLDAVAHGRNWTRVAVDATTVYRNALGYRSFPKEAER